MYITTKTKSRALVILERPHESEPWSATATNLAAVRFFGSSAADGGAQAAEQWLDETGLLDAACDAATLGRPFGATEKMLLVPGMAGRRVWVELAAGSRLLVVVTFVELETFEPDP